MQQIGIDMKSRILVAALAANSVFSALTGIVLSVGAVSVSDWLGVPTEVTLGIGLGLLPFALLVAKTARHPEWSLVIGVVVADLLWVVGAVVVLVLFPTSLSTQGSWALGAVTVVVGVLAVLQVAGLGDDKRDRQAGSASWEQSA